MATPRNGTFTSNPSLSARADQNIVLTGFMGTGKTTVGRRLADLVQRRFVDTDAEIVYREGRSIPRIFADDGEFVFRALERKLCAELAAQNRLVISTGGGMLVDEGNRELMLSSGFVVCLQASAETIGQRLAGANSRPLAANWQELFEKRRLVYAAIPTHVDTTNKTPDQTAQEIIRLWQSR